MSYLPASGNISLTSIRSTMNGGNSLSSYRMLISLQPPMLMGDYHRQQLRSLIFALKASKLMSHLVAILFLGMVT